MDVLLQVMLRDSRRWPVVIVLEVLTQSKLINTNLLVSFGTKGVSNFGGGGG